MGVLSENPADSRSEEAARGAMFRTPEDNVFGNRRGGARSKERYTELARRVWEVMTGPAKEDD